MPWLYNQEWFLKLARPFMWAYWYFDRLRDKLRLYFWGKKDMIRIAVVGDLSLQDPSRLETAMAAAFEDGDLLVHVGDIHPGYSVVKDYAAKGKPLYAIPGNHDTEWDTQLDWPRQWVHDMDHCTIVGMDNSADHFNNDDWAALDKGLELSKDKPLVLFVHKPLSTIILSDGSESGHIMGEGNLPNADAERLKGIVEGKDVLFCHGHYHGLALMRPAYGDVLIEGRGGAAPQIGYTVITVRSEGWSLHFFNL